MALINCPECGKQISINAKKCIHCGFPIPQQVCPQCFTEYNAQLAACPTCGYNPVQAAEAAAEQERIRKEREAQAAEEARIRAEKKAARWAKNKKKIIISGASVILLIVVSIIAIVTIKNKEVEKKIMLAEQCIAAGDSCVSIYHFDEAEELYNQASNLIENEELQRSVWNKQHDLNDARERADEEYNQSLKRLKILLDADDYVFNQYSNECLDKMIQIYPERSETKYYKNMRGK